MMSALLVIFEVVKQKLTMSKSSHFFRQPIHGQLIKIKSLSRDKIVEMSCRNGDEKWIIWLRIIDSTTLSLFSNAIFKYVGWYPKMCRKKGDIKVHSHL